MQPHARTPPVQMAPAARERRSPTGIARERETRTNDAVPRRGTPTSGRHARERETSADDGAPYRREWRTPCSIRTALFAALRAAVPTGGRRSLASASWCPWGYPPRCVARRLAPRPEGERGESPLSHIPPKTRAANGVRCHQSFARSALCAHRSRSAGRETPTAMLAHGPDPYGDGETPWGRVGVWQRCAIPVACCAMQGLATGVSSPSGGRCRSEGPHRENCPALLPARRCVRLRREESRDGEWRGPAPPGRERPPAGATGAETRVHCVRFRRCTADRHRMTR